MTAQPTVAVLGAGGLIGAALAEDMARRGWPLLALARRFTRAQRAALGEAALQTPFARLGAGELGRQLAGAIARPHARTGRAISVKRARVE